MASLTFDIYLRAGVDEVWEALTDPDVVSRWRFGMSFETGWRPGSPLTSHHPDGTGTVLAAVPATRLVYDWRDEEHPDLNHGLPSTVAFHLSHLGEVTHLRVVHDGLAPGSPFLGAVTEGWPMALSSLKSLLETGETLPFPRQAA